MLPRPPEVSDASSSMPPMTTRFGLGHGWHHLANPAAQYLAVVEVLVDDALGRPVERA